MQRGLAFQPRPKGVLQGMTQAEGCGFTFGG
jgi:hypothetical protein